MKTKCKTMRFDKNRLTLTPLAINISDEPDVEWCKNYLKECSQWRNKKEKDVKSDEWRFIELMRLGVYFCSVYPSFILSEYFTEARLAYWQGLFRSSIIMNCLSTELAFKERLRFGGADKKLLAQPFGRLLDWLFIRKTKPYNGKLKEMVEELYWMNALRNQFNVHPIPIHQDSEGAEIKPELNLEYIEWFTELVDFLDKKDREKIMIFPLGKTFDGGKYTLDNFRKDPKKNQEDAFSCATSALEFNKVILPKLALKSHIVLRRILSVSYPSCFLAETDMCFTAYFGYDVPEKELQTSRSRPSYDLSVPKRFSDSLPPLSHSKRVFSYPANAYNFEKRIGDASESRKPKKSGPK